MSKIAEKKALEIYPDIEINWTMTDRTKERMIYADGYDQAMQDFLEKAEKFFNDMYDTIGKSALGKKTIELFKNYMQDGIIR